MIQPTRQDAGLLERLSWPDSRRLTVSAARAFMDIAFRDDDLERMNLLSARARAGTLSNDEQRELDEYEVVSHLLAIMHLKARRALKRRRGVS